MAHAQVLMAFLFGCVYCQIGVDVHGEDLMSVEYQDYGGIALFGCRFRTHLGCFRTAEQRE
jgi:hypothetical protein